MSGVDYIERPSNSPQRTGGRLFTCVLREQREYRSYGSRITFYGLLHRVGCPQDDRAPTLFESMLCGAPNHPSFFFPCRSDIRRRHRAGTSSALKLSEAREEVGSCFSARKRQSNLRWPQAKLAQRFRPSVRDHRTSLLLRWYCLILFACCRPTLSCLGAWFRFETNHLRPTHGTISPCIETIIIRLMLILPYPRYTLLKSTSPLATDPCCSLNTYQDHTR